ncbi:hypothetical protein KAU11_02580 [Candidatus Babeliales bacterium]|nr:hypothetical protein [Candidatus Babeliales bacterium]
MKYRSVNYSFILSLVFSACLDVFPQISTGQNPALNNAFLVVATKVHNKNLNIHRTIKIAQSLFDYAQTIPSLQEDLEKLKDVFDDLKNKKTIQKHHIRRLQRTIENLKDQTYLKIRSFESAKILIQLCSELKIIFSQQFATPYSTSQKVVDLLFRRPVETIKRNPGKAIIGAGITAASAAIIWNYYQQQAYIPLPNSLGNVRAYQACETAQTSGDWVIAQDRNSCWMHALKRCCMIMQKKKQYSGPLDGRDVFAKQALIVRKRREIKAISQCAEKLQNSCSKISKKLEQIKIDCTNGKYSNPKDSTLVEHKTDIKERIQNMKHEAPRGQHDLLDELRRHATNIIYQSQPTAGESELHFENDEGLREIIADKDVTELENLRSNTEGKLWAQDFSLVSKPRSWAQALKKKRKITDPMFLHLIENVRRYRNNPSAMQVMTLNTFASENQNACGRKKDERSLHYVPVIFKRNPETKKDNCEFLESTTWWISGKQEQKQQHETLKNMSYILSHAPLSEI